MSDQRFDQNLRIKYWCDRFFALVLILLVSPLGFLIAASIVIESILVVEPPCIFVGEMRRSANRTFRLLKFRVFRVRSRQYHLAHEPMRSVKGLEKKPHLTWVGRLLKRCYLDELPQLLNILRGEMSLVGPRPYFEGDWLRQSRLDIPARRLLKAGLVGPYGAVKGRISGPERAERENLLDTRYLDYVSFASAPRLLLCDLKTHRAEPGDGDAGQRFLRTLFAHLTLFYEKKSMKSNDHLSSAFFISDYIVEKGHFLHVEKGTI